MDAADLVARAIEERRGPPADLSDQAEVMVATAEAMAGRLREGGTLLAAGSGCFRTDAEHIAVEFMHPVIMGTSAIPATVVPPWQSPADAVGRLARPGDVVVAVGDVDLGGARDAGLLTVALVAGESERTAEHTLAVATANPWLAKEGFVTAYHLLWELTHVFLGGGTLAGSELGGTAALYPFLAGGGGPSAVEDTGRSSRAKLRDIVDLRRAVLTTEAAALARCAEALASRRADGGRVLTFGNGGSSTDAASLALALALTPPEGGAVPAWSLADDRATLTALANDVSFDVVFARQLDALAQPADVCIGLSTSGSSPNVLRGLETAHRRGALTVGFAGNEGGDMAASDAVDHLFVVPSSSVHRIQEVQASLYLTLAGVTRELCADRERRRRPPARG